MFSLFSTTTFKKTACYLAGQGGLHVNYFCPNDLNANLDILTLSSDNLKFIKSEAVNRFVSLSFLFKNATDDTQSSDYRTSI